MGNATTDTPAATATRLQDALQEKARSRSAGSRPFHVAIALAFTTSVLFAVVLLKAASFKEAQRYDFSVRYASGLILRRGGGAKLYDAREQARVQEELFPGRGFMPDFHPPFELCLYAPLTRLSYLRAYIVWGGINILLWMVFVYLARKCATVPRQAFQYLILGFTFFPFWITLHHGQTSILLALAYCLSFLCLKKQHDFKAGSFLGLGLIKFQLVVPFVLIFALRRKWRFVAGFTSAALALAVLSTALVGAEGVRGYIGVLAASVNHAANPVYRSMVVTNMPNLRGLFTALLGGRIASKWIDALVAVSSGGLILFTAKRWRTEDTRGREASTDMMFALALTVSLLTGFYLFVDDLSPLLIAILVAIGSPRWGARSWWRLIGYASIVTLYIPLVYLLLIDWGKLYLLTVVLAAFLCGALGMARRREPAGPAKDTTTNKHLEAW